jgi:hypothetical protein
MEAMEPDISEQPERLERAIERLRHPRPGSKIEAAQRFGVDLTLLIANLRRTPAERVRHMEEMRKIAETCHGAACLMRR